MAAIAQRSDVVSSPPACLEARIRRVQAALRQSAPPSRTRVGWMTAYHLGRIDASGRPAHGDAGKTLRGGLCLWMCEALGGADEAALQTALALELIHNFTLVHDDIQDQDTKRRHRPALWTVVGTSQGINAGDGLHTLAHLALTAPGPRPARRLRAAHAVSRGVLDVIEGQCLDLALERRCTTSMATYLGLARAKTGALFGAALEAGAILAGAPATAATRLRGAGRELGAAFQVRDDWLGAFGDPVLTGKPCGADLRRRKLTAVVVAAYRHATRTQRALLRELFTRDDDEATALLLALVHHLGGPELCNGAADRLAEAAVDGAQRAGLGGAALDELAAVAHFAAARSR
ncbi:MAG TPA: polyprenyl synthetase family protein [Candidatus Dormibacteraeota bacterium]